MESLAIAGSAVDALLGTVSSQITVHVCEQIKGPFTAKLSMQTLGMLHEMSNIQREVKQDECSNHAEEPKICGFDGRMGDVAASKHTEDYERLSCRG